MRQVDESLYYIKRLDKDDVTYTFARSGGAGVCKQSGEVFWFVIKWNRIFRNKP